MRILLIKDFAEDLPAALGLITIAAVLKQAGHEVHLAHASPEAAGRELAAFEPGVVGYSVMTTNFGRYLDLNRELKRRWPFVSVFGGPHPTFFPEMIAEDGVDVVCLGEGEGAAAELAELVAAGRDFAGVRNLWVKGPAGVRRNPLRPLESDLDRLPFPDRGLVGEALGGPPPLVTVMASRGCPFRCSYCFNRRYRELYRGRGQVLRCRSVASVVAELKEAAGSGRPAMVGFLDDIFGLKLDWLAEFAEAYPREVGIPFFCNLHPMVVRREQVALLARAGCISAGLGVETADERLRRDVLGRRIPDRQIETAVRLLHDHGILVGTYNLVGFPGSSLASDLATLRLNARLRPYFARGYVYEPLPGTELAERAVRLGMFDGRMDGFRHGDLRHSRMTYDSPAAKSRLENLTELFGLATARPALMPLVPWLIRLPRNRLFALAYGQYFRYASWKLQRRARRRAPGSLNPFDASRPRQKRETV